MQEVRNDVPVASARMQGNTKSRFRITYNQQGYHNAINNGHCSDISPSKKSRFAFDAG